MSLSGTEGSGWFIARYAPDGRRRWVDHQPGLESEACRLLRLGGGRRRARIVAGNRFGCCGNPFNHGYSVLDTTGGKLLSWPIPFDDLASSWKFDDGVIGVAAGSSGTFNVVGLVATALQQGETDFVDQDVVIQAVSSAGTVTATVHPWRVDHGTRDVDLHPLIGGARRTPRGHRRRRPARLRAEPRVARGLHPGWQPPGRTGGARPSTATSRPPQVSRSCRDGAVYVAGSRRDKSDGGWDIVVRRLGRVARSIRRASWSRASGRCWRAMPRFAGEGGLRRRL